MPTDRDKYLDAAKSILERNIFNHSLALEACMGGIYDYLKQNNQLNATYPKKEEWLTAGLLHDIDYAGEFKQFHPLKTKEVLDKFGITISDSAMRIIKTHAPDLTGEQPKNKAEWAIFCADSLTGLIVAVALVYPTKKLADVKLSSIVKRFLKEPKFAAGTRREEVKQCENSEGLNIPLEKFIEICLTSMQKIAGEKGL